MTLIIREHGYFAGRPIKHFSYYSDNEVYEKIVPPSGTVIPDTEDEVWELQGKLLKYASEAHGGQTAL